MAGWVDMTASVSRCVCRLGPLPFSDKLTAFASRLLPYIQTFKLQTFKDVNVCPHIQSRTFTHVLVGIVRHVHPLQVSAFLRLAVQDCIEYSGAVAYFLPDH